VRFLGGSAYTPPYRDRGRGVIRIRITWRSAYVSVSTEWWFVSTS